MNATMRNELHYLATGRRVNEPRTTEPRPTANEFRAKVAERFNSLEAALVKVMELRAEGLTFHEIDDELWGTGWESYWSTSYRLVHGRN